MNCCTTLCWKKCVKCFTYSWNCYFVFKSFNYYLPFANVYYFLRGIILLNKLSAPQSLLHSCLPSTARYKAVDGHKRQGGGCGGQWGGQRKRTKQRKWTKGQTPPQKNNNHEVIIMCLFSFKGQSLGLLFSILLLFCLSQGISDGTVLV